MTKKDRGLDYSLEISARSTIRNTLPMGMRVAEFVKDPMQGVIVVAFVFGIGFFMPMLLEFAILFGFLTTYLIWKIQFRAALPMHIPKKAGIIDHKNIDPTTERPTKAEGIIYVGNDQETNEEVWMSDTQARTHCLYMGTTGSGKTEFLLGTVFNALIHGSSFIYVDGKADTGLYSKIYAMARIFGREDDVLVINFQTGAKDIYGAQPFKMSNTMNPFAVGSSGMLSQLVIGLMSSGKDGGKSDVWENRAISFVEAIMKPLVFLRDNYGFALDVEVIRDYFDLKKLEELAWRDKDKYPGLEQVLGGLHSYLMNLPTYDKAKFQRQGETCLEQHGYITMQLVRTFNSLADTYGYIMKTPLAEIDFVDVFLNRRILIVLLPALEKSPPELTNLGRIIVASLKATMAVGLGARIEGDTEKIIDSKPTNAPSPFMCVLDEYGYYAVEGFAVVPAQARSLGFSAIFAGQDLPAFEKASKSEAESTLANTNTKYCGKLECTKTYQYFKDLAGQGYYSRTGGFQADSGGVGMNYLDTNAASIERFDRVTLDDLKGLASGKWYMFFGTRIIRLKSFFTGKNKVKTLRVNHFIRVSRPSKSDLDNFTKAKNALSVGVQKGFIDGALIDTVPIRDFMLLNEGFDASQQTGVGAAIDAFSSFVNEDRIRAMHFDRMMSTVSNRIPSRKDIAPQVAMEEPPSALDDIMDKDLVRERRNQIVHFEADDSDGSDSIGDEPIEVLSLGGNSQQKINLSPDDWRTDNDFEAVPAQQVARASTFDFGEEVPSDGTAFDDSFYGIDPPEEGQGMLNRDQVEEGLARIEAQFDSPDEAEFKSSSIGSSLAERTKYPISMPQNGEQDVGRCLDVIGQLSHAIDDLMTKRDKK